LLKNRKAGVAAALRRTTERAQLSESASRRQAAMETPVGGNGSEVADSGSGCLRPDSILLCNES